MFIPRNVVSPLLYISVSAVDRFSGVISARALLMKSSPLFCCTKVQPAYHLKYLTVLKIKGLLRSSVFCLLLQPVIGGMLRVLLILKRPESINNRVPHKIANRPQSSSPTTAQCLSILRICFQCHCKLNSVKLTCLPIERVSV